MSKMVKVEEKEDRISDLPDPIIQHILSYLPSTRQAIRTGILSKRWKNQWTQVPVLIFKNSTGMPFKNFVKFIDSTLIRHDCYKINKFHLYLRSCVDPEIDPEIASKIDFATSRGVEDLNLSLSMPDLYLLPEFFFNNASVLVKLRTEYCTFMPNEKVNWGSLTTLSMVGCQLTDQAIEHIVSGSPLLESFELYSCSGLEKVVVASQSLKRLVVGRILSGFSIEISCPKLEKLKLFESLNVMAAKLLNLSSSLCATIDFNVRVGMLQTHKSLVENILSQLQHVNELKIGSWFISILSTIKVGGGLFPLLNTKCLTFDTPDHLKKHHSGIARLLHISHVLEKLIINVPPHHKFNHKLGKNYWNSNATFFDCLVSHLKTIKIVGFRFPEGDVRHQHMLNLVQFLLNNAKVLEKLVVIFKDDGTGIPLKVSQELLSLPKCSRNVIIEFLCVKKIGNLL